MADDRLRDLELRIDTLSTQMMQQNAQIAALRLSLHSLAATLVRERRLEFKSIMDSLAEIERQAIVSSTTDSSLAHEIRNIRSEFGGIVAPALPNLNRSLLAKIRRGLAG